MKILLTCLVSAFMVSTGMYNGFLKIDNPKYSDFHRQAIVVFSYDDGRLDNYKYAYPLHVKYNIPATFNIITSSVDKVDAVMTSAQLKELSDAGFEIASHSHTHPLKSNGRDFSELTEQETIDEAVISKKYFKEWGLPEPEGFVIPGSKYADFQVPILSKEYKYVRAYNGRNDVPTKPVETSANTNAQQYISYPLKDTYDIGSIFVKGNFDKNVLIWLIDQAIANKKMVVFMMHGISDGKESSEYEFDKAKLESVLSYLASKPKSEALTLSLKDAVKFASQ